MATNKPKQRPKSKTIDPSGTAVPIAYSSSNASSLLLSSLRSNNIEYTGLYISNNSATALYVRAATGDDGVPASDGTDTQELLIPANFAQSFDFFPCMDKVFIRSSSGSTITSGLINVAVFSS